MWEYNYAVHLLGCLKLLFCAIRLSAFSDSRLKSTHAVSPRTISLRIILSLSHQGVLKSCNDPRPPKGIR